MAKKYIDAELLIVEINKHYDDYRAKFHQNGERYYLGLIDGIDMTKRIIDSLQQEQSCDTCTNDKGCVTCKDGELWEGKEQPSEDLEEAAEEYQKKARKHIFDNSPIGTSKDAFIAGAEWQKKQNTIRTRYKTRLDCYEQGRQDMREEMLKEAVEGEVIEDLHGQRYVKSEAVDETKFNFGDKVKIIIVKED